VTNSSSESDSEDEDDLNVEAFMGLLPVPPDRRKRLLARSGNETGNAVSDSFQQNENQLVRTSRESCGCSCEGICYPETCECYINDIGCQVCNFFYHSRFLISFQLLFKIFLRASDVSFVCWRVF